MFFKLFFKGHALSKKFFIFSACSLTFGSIVHWGIIKPFQNHQNAEHLEGSNAILEKNKGDPYYEDLSSVNWTENLNSVYEDLPSVYPNLTKQHAKFEISELNSQFNSSIKNAILAKTDVVADDDKWLTVFKDAQRIKRLDHISQFSTVSRIEIPYKSYFYNQQARLLTESHIIKDLIFSLAEESEFNKTSIRPDSIKIDFQLEKIKSEDVVSDRRILPLKANKVHELNISFKIYNPNNHVNYVFKSIPIQPYRETQFNIFLRESELRPISTDSSSTAAWSLFPTEDNKFEISMEDSYPKFEVYKFSVPNLSLVYGKSQWMKGITNFDHANLPTFNDFYKLSIPYLSNITKDQIKKDIETFYGALSAWNMRLLIKDIQELITVMTTKNLETPNGTQSTLERVLSDKSFRYGLYSFLYFDDKSQNAVEKSLGSGDISVEGVAAFLENMKKTLEEILEATSISITWHSEPRLSAPVDGDMSPFPSVSFDFSRTITWNKKITFPLSGCWDFSNGSYSKSDSKKCSESNKQFFNFYALFEGKLFDIFKDILGDVNGLGLIPDAEQFLKIDSLEIEKDESITTRFTSKNSPMRFSLYNSIDKSAKYQALPGWKAMDISASYDLSKFHKFFQKIYEKINNFEDKKNGIYLDSFWSAAGSIGKISQLLSPNSKEFQAKGISSVVHLINHLFDSSSASEPDENRPFAVFFKTLFSEPFKFDSTQFISGWSTSMLDLSNLDIFNGTNAKLSNDWQSYSNKNNPSKSEDEWEFPVKFKSKKMEKLSMNYKKNYSVFYPKAPIVFSVFEFGKDKAWNQFLKKQGSTNIGFVFYKDEIKGIIRNFLDAEFNKNPSLQIFPNSDLFDWNKVKLSVVRLKLAQALKSVLSLRYKSLATLVDSYLKWSQMSLQHMFGEFIQRDNMVVIVNMMSEDFAINAISPNSLFSISDPSLSILTLAVKPSFKPDLLEDEFKKSFIGSKIKF